MPWKSCKKFSVCRGQPPPPVPCQRIVMIKGKRVATHDPLRDQPQLVSSAASDSHGSPEHAAESKATSAEGRPEPRTMLSKRDMIWDLAVRAVAAAVSGVSGLIGIGHLPWPALVLLSVSVGAGAFTVTQAITAREIANPAVRWWSLSTAILLLVVAGAVSYHKLWDPATHGSRLFPFVVNGSELDVIPLYGEAAGPPQLLATGAAGENGLIGVKATVSTAG